MSGAEQAESPVSQRTWALIVWACYAASFFTLGVASFTGLIIAYVKRNEFAGAQYYSHMVSAIRTFWVSLAIGVLGIFSSLFGIGALIVIAVACWFLFRTVRGLIKAIEGKAIDDPMSWL